MSKKKHKPYEPTAIELTQLKEYITIFIEHGFQEQRYTNEYITERNLWHRFTAIRSHNDHGMSLQVPGILPIFYAITCDMLKIQGGSGAPLDKATPY